MAMALLDQLKKEMFHLGNLCRVFQSALGLVNPYLTQDELYKIRHGDTSLIDKYGILHVTKGMQFELEKEGLI